MKFNGYELSRNWFDFCFENPEKIKPNHTAMYFFAIEHCNRLGWKQKFGFPSQMVMDALGIKNWRTYKKTLNDLIEFGFIEIIELSKNQYSSNIISIKNAYVKNTKALDKAMQKHAQKQHTKQGQSTVSINKPINNITNNNIVSHDFYKGEIEDNKNKSQIDNYKKFYDILLGVNSDEGELTGLLSMAKQVSYKSFEGLFIKSKVKSKKFSEIMPTMNNDKKYYSKISLSRTLHDWIRREFK